LVANERLDFSAQAFLSARKTKIHKM